MAASPIMRISTNSVRLRGRNAPRVAWMPIRGPDWAPIDNRILESGISLRKSRQQPAIIRPPDHICALGIATIEGKDGPDLAGGGGMEAGTDLLLGGLTPTYSIRSAWRGRLLAHRSVRWLQPPSGVGPLSLRPLRIGSVLWMTDLAEWRTHWSERTDIGKWRPNIPTWPKTPLLPSFAATWAHR
jgi:hypothetical protein